MPSRAIVPESQRLPTSARELLARKKTADKRSLNDHTMDYILRIFDDPELGPQFREYMNPIRNNQAVTGDVKLDRGKAAEIIEKLAKEEGNPHFDDVLLIQIVRAIGVAFRRFEDSSPKDRANIPTLENQPEAAE